MVHQNPRPAEAQTVQIISGSQLQAINGQIVTKAVQQQEEEEQAAESGEAASAVTTSQQSGLTITPVSATAAAAATSSAAARPQQTVAVSGVQPGQIIQVKISMVVSIIIAEQMN